MKACVLLDGDGRLLSVDAAHEADGEPLAKLGRELFDRAGTDQVEVSTGTGIVYALRTGGRAMVVVAGRFALSSLIFFDVRRTLEELGG